MKSRNILLFILACIVLLALLSWSIPNGRIALGSYTLRFPPMSDILDLNIPADSTTTQEYHAEELIRKHLAQKQLDKAQQLAYKITHHPTAIAVPNDSLGYFDNFFASLQEAQTRPMRIAHFGDSQIEEDRISGILREQFQSEYGGNVVGLVPTIQTVHTTAIRQSCNTAMRRYLIYGPANYRHPENLYGVLGHMAQLKGKATWQFRAAGMKRTQPGTKHYSQATLMIGQPTTPVTLYASRGDYFTDTLKVDTTQQELTFLTLHLQGYGAEANITAEGKANIYGILLDGTTGVSLDNIPMRGSSGTVFTAIESSTLKPYFNKYHIPLIILQYGGNTVPYLKGKTSIANYCSGMARQI